MCWIDLDDVDLTGGVDGGASLSVVESEKEKGYA